MIDENETVAMRRKISELERTVKRLKRRGSQPVRPHHVQGPEFSHRKQELSKSALRTFRDRGIETYADDGEVGIVIRVAGKRVKIPGTEV